MVSADAPPTDAPSVAADAPSRFPTKRGECRLEAGTLVFEESLYGYLRSLYAGYWRSDAWWRKLLFVGYLLVPVFAVGSLVFGEWTPLTVGVFLTLLAGLLAVAAYRYLVRNVRRATAIPLDSLREVTATRGTKGLTRPRLRLTYVAAGETYRRDVLLPSLYLPHGDRAFADAVALFEARGFDVDGAGSVEVEADVDAEDGDRPSDPPT